jgi:hypothetical protein
MNVITPYMVNNNDWNWGLKTGWFYAGLGLPFTVAIWFLIPETAGYVHFAYIIYPTFPFGVLLSKACRV